MLATRKKEWIVEEKQTVLSSAPKVQRNKSRVKVKGLAMLFLIAVIAMVVVIRNEAIVSKGYNLVQLKKQVSQLEKETELIKLEVAKLKSHQRIQQIATSNLGLVKPQDVYYASYKAKEVNTMQTVRATVNNLLPVRLNKAEASKAR